MTGAAHHRGSSKQDYCTPRRFLDAVESRFGAIVLDAAASAENAVCAEFYTEADNALVQSWTRDGLTFCNPPFSNIAPWADKCAMEAALGARIAFLVPAAVGANWFWDYVIHNAHVLSVGRMIFVTRDADGTEHPVLDGKGRPAQYPKDLILPIFGDPSLPPGFERWQWKKPRSGRDQASLFEAAQ